VAGVRQTWRRSRAHHGDYIYFMALEDLEGMLDVIIPAKVYARCRNALRTSGPYLIEGVIAYNEERGEPALYAENIDAVAVTRTDPNAAGGTSTHELP
jgi:DNA polymerase III alpha subunit